MSGVLRPVRRSQSLAWALRREAYATLTERFGAWELPPQWRQGSGYLPALIRDAEAARVGPALQTVGESLRQAHSSRYPSYQPAFPRDPLPPDNYTAGLEPMRPVRAGQPLLWTLRFQAAQVQVTFVLPLLPGYRPGYLAPQARDSFEDRPGTSYQPRMPRGEFFPDKLPGRPPGFVPENRPESIWIYYETGIHRDRKYVPLSARILVGESLSEIPGSEYRPRLIQPEVPENLPGGAGRIMEVSGLVPFLEPPAPGLFWSVRFDPATQEIRGGAGRPVQVRPEDAWITLPAPYLPSLLREAPAAADQVPGRVIPLRLWLDLDLVPGAVHFLPFLRREEAPPQIFPFRSGVEDIWSIPRGGKLWTVPDAIRGGRP